MSAHSKADHPRVVTVVGATASGKTDAAILIAQQFGGEVINSDSRIFYRGLDIGTAKPGVDQLALVPHHLVDFLSIDDPYSLSQFVHDASGLIRKISNRDRLPVIAGGTGQYVWGLLEGWQVPVVPANPELRRTLELELEESGVANLYARLKTLDAEVAEAVDGNNPRRVVRALERLMAGVPSPTREAIDPGYDSLVIGLFVERAELHQRIENRVDLMFAAGWVDEVKGLIATGIDFDLPPLSAIGYREIAAAIAGDMSMDEARERTIRNTNRLVRHQNNWFKQDDARIRWVNVTDGDITPVAETVRKWLSD